MFLAVCLDSRPLNGLQSFRSSSPAVNCWAIFSRPLNADWAE